MLFIFQVKTTAFAEEDEEKRLKVSIYIAIWMLIRKAGGGMGQNLLIKVCKGKFLNIKKC